MDNKEFLKKKFGYFTPRIDHFSVLSSDVSNEFRISKVRDVDWKNQYQQRAGVIVYFKNESSIVFGMGIDADSGDITDFGGGIKRIDKNPIYGALREFNEESLGVFGNYTFSMVENYNVIYNSMMLILFIPVDDEISSLNEKFQKRVENTRKPEVKSIIWITLSNLLNTIHTTNRIYKPVNHLLNFLNNIKDEF